MSVWAQAWAYDQRVGNWRENRSGKSVWRGDSGAKSVLVALATFADENGYCFVGQETLARMTDMSERSVREHLHNLEDAYKKIHRKHRRKGGKYTSDGTWLSAPKERLKPPENSRQESPTAEFAVGEKRTRQRQSSPPDQRQNLPPNRQYEPSEEPSVVAQEELPTDDVTARCLLLLSEIKGFPRDNEANTKKITEYRECFSNANPVEVCEDFAAFIDEKPFRKNDKPRLRLRNFFKTADKSPSRGPANGQSPPGEYDHPEKTETDYEWWYA